MRKSMKTMIIIMSAISLTFIIVGIIFGLKGLRGLLFFGLGLGLIGIGMSLVLADGIFYNTRIEKTIKPLYEFKAVDTNSSKDCVIKLFEDTLQIVVDDTIDIGLLDIQKVDRQVGVIIFETDTSYSFELSPIEAKALEQKLKTRCVG